MEFESITSECFSEQQFKDWVNCVLNASEEQLRKLEYTTEEYEKTFLFKPRLEEVKEAKERRNKWIQILGILISIILVFLSPYVERIVDFFLV